MSDDTAGTAPTGLVLRDVVDADILVLHRHQQDPAARHMAAFTSVEPPDVDAFRAWWDHIRANPEIVTRAIDVAGVLAGSILMYRTEGKPEVSYWIGSEFWGRGIATAALAAFLDVVTERPLYARAAADNIGSIRVLEKCGFDITATERGFAEARKEEIDEVVMELAGG